MTIDDKRQRIAAVSTILGTLARTGVPIPIRVEVANAIKAAGASPTGKHVMELTGANYKLLRDALETAELTVNLAGVGLSVKVIDGTLEEVMSRMADGIDDDEPDDDEFDDVDRIDIGAVLFTFVGGRLAEMATFDSAFAASRSVDTLAQRRLAAGEDAVFLMVTKMGEKILAGDLETVAPEELARAREAVSRSSWLGSPS